MFAEALQIPADQAALALGALAAVLPGDDDAPAADDASEADLHANPSAAQGEARGAGAGHVGGAVLTEALQIPAEQVAPALGVLAVVLPGDDDDPATDGAGASPPPSIHSVQLGRWRAGRAVLRVDRSGSTPERLLRWLRDLSKVCWLICPDWGLLVLLAPGLCCSKLLHWFPCRHPSFSSRDGIRHTEGTLLHRCDEQ
ncbi:uncharacterized protein [Triticum aestivum]|uniref:uncharacterized protein isoform X2 n=1 Tax=Triticum aestivum TaxID=4565 RepID=UPI001D00F783|nr:uncharacterized protein LOC123050455 isoform X2 [Triticum aestivum]